ncbi:cytochrome b/b6 domain-containing protein [Paracoccus amoyensis]|nr:cytochrome b/b6 domain-containing protein [Paracoccus amoyensis]
MTITANRVDMVQDSTKRVRVWDLALRIYHWSLATLVIANWLLGKFGPDVMTLHFWFGYAIIALLAFRLVWGFIGPESARFSSFLPSPSAIATYLKTMFRREPSHWPGHNPIGALAVFAMLAALIWQTWTGMISDPDDFINVGPLADKVSSATAGKAVGWHELGANIILILVIPHISAIAFYRLWKREDLIQPMITGWKWVRRR